jgi:endonuclease YncB( thermonuclease family)
MARLRCLLLCCLLALAVAPAAGAQESREPCVPDTAEPVCTFWTGTVTHISDGDTLDVDLGNGIPARVRITGIQAMEQTAYSRNQLKRRGDCHALEATARLEQLVAAAGGTVRVSAIDPESRSGARLRRSVSVWIDGAWHDVGRLLVDEGHALWLPNGHEWAWNGTYSVLARQAADRHENLWNSEYCAGGPPAALRLWVNWDADGDDGANPAGEWVRIKNLDPVEPVWIGGWWLRDSSLRRFTFPSDTTIPPGGAVTVNVGAAPPGALGWGLGAPIFENVRPDDHGIGDGAYLFDPEGDLRAWMTYPCRWACADPASGMLQLRAQPTGRETIAVRNTGDRPVDLEGYRLATAGRGYAFGPDSVLAPGEALRLRVQGSPSNDTRLDRSWGADRPLLADGGGTVRLQTLDGIAVACDAWKVESCAP